VLKVMNGVQGKGVELVRTKDELRAMLSMLTAAPFGDHIIAQQAIMSSAGKDIRVVVAGGEVLHSFVRSNDGEFKSNLHQGGHIETFEPPADLVDMSIRLADALGLKLGSIDYLFGENEGEFWLCEVNSTPGIAYLFAAQETGDTALLKKFMAMPGRLLAREGVKI
jgi:glutathione synthase/RimK-type ligase-like ATP-grasp enzyme